MEIPSGARQIIEALEHHGYEAYIVGGCVRDMLIDRVPEDWDITTSAEPDQVKRIFRRTVDTGIEHGTVTVLIGDEGYEVTTYRTDGIYEDHRHPTEVTFTPNLEEDLKRRDFTINAMAYNEKDGLVDLFGGQEDLERGIIRCVGDPMQRFDEDALRMLRGIRFAGQLLFEIEESTLAAIRELAPTLVNISAERIRVELTKLLISAGSDRLRLAYETGLTPYFLPEFDAMMRCPQANPHHCYDVGEHTLAAIAAVNSYVADGERTGLDGDIGREAAGADGVPVDRKQHIALAFAALLHDVAKPVCKTTDEEGIDHFHGHDVKGEEMAGQILRRLKFDNDTIRLVKTLVRWHDVRYKACVEYPDTDAMGEGDVKPLELRYSPKGRKSMRRLMNRAGRDTMPFLFLLQRADICAQSDHKRDEKQQVLAAGERCYREICEAQDAVTISELAITGRDLIDEKGYQPGPAIGAELARLLDLVMEDPSLNTREQLLDETHLPV
ncbi:MAG: CCA tRNA nucleotidyltransferase [Eubacterium sp.]|nr:CCA tRNA nucleotidyltransferase [Eubacterium sp.]